MPNSPKLRRLLLAAIPALLLACLATASVADRGPDVAVVFGEYSYMESPRGEGAGALSFMQNVRRALDLAGVPYTVLGDMAAETDGLLPYKLAIFPYNFTMPASEEAAIERYVDGGGRIIVLYSITDRVADLLGLQVGERVEGDFQALKLDPTKLSGLPDRVSQGSWNVRPVEPARPDAEVIGEWVDSTGAPAGVPGLAISSTGAYMGHVLTDADLESKAEMFLALIARFLPDIRSQASARAAAEAARIIDNMAERSLARPQAASRQRAQAVLDRARARLRSSEDLARAGSHSEAITAAMEARRLAVDAYVSSAPERLNEFRGVWLHDAYGVPGWGWERTARELHEAGFNAIIANMLWAGQADYPSEVLPVSPRVAEEGDQIAEALKSCKEYGLELHVWKVNYNLQNAPEEFVEKLRAEGRLQRNRSGEEVRWLCPSDPRNFALERDSMLEIVRKYDVAGIHFDYIRYPDDQTCYCDGCRERFTKDAGVEIRNWPADVIDGPLAQQYTQWRRDQITRLVRAVSTEARRLRPGLMISAAVFSWPGAIDWVNQNWPQWVDEGLLDFICPMNYTADRDELARMVTGEVGIVRGRLPLYIGVGEFIIPETDQLIDQIELARHLGADGFVCFSYEHLGRTEGRLAGLHEALTADPISPPHPAPRIDVSFFPVGEKGDLGPVFPHDAGIQVTVWPNAGDPETALARADSGLVSIETTDGEEQMRLGRISSGPPDHSWTVRLDPGLYRVVVRGTATVGSEEECDFVVRSEPFEVR